MVAWDDLKKIARRGKKKDLPEGLWTLCKGCKNTVYKATVEATEEAIVNALFGAKTMTGRDGNTRHALPLDQVERIFEKYGRPLNRP